MGQHAAAFPLHIILIRSRQALIYVSSEGPRKLEVNLVMLSALASSRFSDQMSGGKSMRPKAE